VAIDRSTKGTVWNIQILRFVAAAMVLFAHLNTEVGKWPAMVAGYPPFEPVWWASGVDIFFVISGFIMYYISVDAFGRPGASMQFVRRRLVRLVPPYWFFTLLTIATMYVFGSHMHLSEVRLPQVIGSFVFFPVENPQGRPFPVLILGWTLEYEMLFYAILAIGLLFRRTIGVALTATILVAVAAAFLAAPLPLPFGFWANPIVIEFIFGIGLAIAYHRGIRLALPMRITSVLLAIALMIWVQAQGWAGHQPPWRFLWAGVPAFLLCAGFVLVEQATAPGPVMRFFIFLGDASYALYLSHPFALAPVAFFVSWTGVTSAYLFIALAMPFCIAVAAALYYFMERPMYAILSRSGSRRRSVAMAPATR
jgi:exopolysaccharide production protein ExoZ